MCKIINLNLLKVKLLNVKSTRWITLLFYTSLISTFNEEYLTLDIDTIIVFQIYID